MWQRFTERARRTILLAQEEAGRMNSGHVGTEHLLLGLLREDQGVAAQILAKMGVSLEAARAQVREMAPPNDDPVSGEPKLTPKAKRILELGADEARRMRHNYIGTEHLLLAITRERDGLGAQILRRSGLDLDQARVQVLDYLGPDAPSQDKPITTTLIGAPPMSEAPYGTTPFRVSPILRHALEIAARESRAAGREWIEIGDLLSALCEDETAPLLRALGIDLVTLRAHLRER